MKKEDWYQRVPLGKGEVQEGEQDCSTRLEAMRALHGDLTGKNVLEIGPAEGFFSMECASSGAIVQAIEKNADMYDKFCYVRDQRGLGEKIGISNTDCMTYLQIETTEKYDIAISTSVIHHLTGPVQHLYDLWRVLKKGGILYLEVPKKDGSAIQIRKGKTFYLATYFVGNVLRHYFSKVDVVLDWNNSVGNHRVMFEATK